jgi:uncharacterized membrane protein
MSGRLTPSWLRRLSQLILVSGAIALTAGVLSGRPVLGLALGLALAATVGWLLLVRPAERFVFLLLVAAFFVVAGVEIVVVADDLIDTVAYRMNTVFKFYNQVWVLLAIAFAVLVAAMARDVVASRSPEAVPTSTTKLRIAWSRAGLGLASVLVAASLTYPVLAIGPRIEQRFEPGTPSGSLNAFAWMEQGTVPVSGSLDFDRLHFRGDEEAIAWLLQNVDGTPVVAEASIGPYRCNGSRISSATGLPTIIGWERHQQQQRYPEDLPPRVRDVRTLYTSPNVAEKNEILNRYNVEFVVVGDLERAYPVANNECTPDGSAAGIAAFDTMIGQNLEVAFTGDGTTIYRVVHPGSNS